MTVNPSVAAALVRLKDFSWSISNTDKLCPPTPHQNTYCSYYTVQMLLFSGGSVLGSAKFKPQSQTTATMGHLLLSLKHVRIMVSFFFLSLASFLPMLKLFFTGLLKYHFSLEKDKEMIDLSSLPPLRISIEWTVAEVVRRTVLLLLIVTRWSSLCPGIHGCSPGSLSGHTE